MLKGEMDNLISVDPDTDEPNDCWHKIKASIIKQNIEVLPLKTRLLPDKVIENLNKLNLF
jgi:hypothetical protein